MTEANPLLGKNVVVRLRTGMIKVGFLLAVDQIFITIEHRGEKQQIPLVSIDAIQEATR
jgi:hypothetical protein